MDDNIHKPMKTNELNQNWEEHKGNLKKKLVELTESDLLFSADKKDEMYGKLQISTEKPVNDFSTDIDISTTIIEL